MNRKLLICTVGCLFTVSSTTTPAQLTPAKGPTSLTLPVNSKPFFPKTLRQSDNPFPFRAIIGRDDRVPMVSREFPWSAVGRIEGVTAMGGRYSCTGTLIAKTIVLTNAHCVINPETHQVSRSMTFKPNLVNGAMKDNRDIGIVEAYYYGTDFKNTPSVVDINDWAILKSDKPLGEKYGYLGWQAPSNATQLTQKLSLVGYSADFPKSTQAYPGLELTAGPGLTAGVHRGCSFVGEQGGLLLHDCDTKGGASGGPILAKLDGEYYVVALHAGWRRTANGKVMNYAVKMSQIEAWLSQQSNTDSKNNQTDSKDK